MYNLKFNKNCTLKYFYDFWEVLTTYFPHIAKQIDVVSQIIRQPYIILIFHAVIYSVTCLYCYFLPPTDTEEAES